MSLNDLVSPFFECLMSYTFEFITVLTLDDLAQVLNCLYHVRSKWLNIGLELGVHITDLTNIEHEGNDDSTRLRRKLTLALNSRQEVTWKQICKALGNPVIGESVYAKRLEAKCT